MDPNVQLSQAAEELADFAHHRDAYGNQKWMSDRIDVFLARNIVIPRSELPNVYESTNGNGICAASAQEFHQPELYFHPADGDKAGEWNRKIAYANLAVADAIDARDATNAVWRQKRRDELASEFTSVNSYNGQLPYTQKLIDRIIELEEAAK